MLKKFVLDVTPDQPGQLQVVVVRFVCKASGVLDSACAALSLPALLLTRVRRFDTAAAALIIFLPPHAPNCAHRPSQVKSEGNKLLEQFRNTSVPHFLFFRNGTRLEVVVGPNAPALDRGLRQYIPKAGEEPDDPMRNRCAPLLLSILSCSSHTHKPKPAVRPSTAHSTKPPTPAAGVPGPSRPRTADMLALNKLLGGVGGASMHRAGSVSRGRDHFPDGPSLDE